MSCEIASHVALSVLHKKKTFDKSVRMGRTVYVFLDIGKLSIGKTIYQNNNI